MNCSRTIAAGAKRSVRVGDRGAERGVWLGAIDIGLVLGKWVSEASPLDSSAPESCNRIASWGGAGPAGIKHRSARECKVDTHWR
jgi:hypothetical protein